MTLPRAGRPEAMPLDPKRAAALEVEIAQLRGSRPRRPCRPRWHSLRGRPAPTAPAETPAAAAACAYQPAGGCCMATSIPSHASSYLDRVAGSGAVRQRCRPCRRCRSPSRASGPARHRAGAGVGGRDLPRAWRSRTASPGTARTYRSLSEVARAITGTRWNGRRFFGVRSGATARHGPEVRP